MIRLPCTRAILLRCFPPARTTKIMQISSSHIWTLMEGGFYNRICTGRGPCQRPQTLPPKATSMVLFSSMMMVRRPTKCSTRHRRITTTKLFRTSTSWECNSFIRPSGTKAAPSRNTKLLRTRTPHLRTLRQHRLTLCIPIPIPTSKATFTTRTLTHRSSRVTLPSPQRHNYCAGPQAHRSLCTPVHPSLIPTPTPAPRSQALVLTAPSITRDQACTANGHNDLLIAYPDALLRSHLR